MNANLLCAPLAARLFETIVAQVPDAVVFTDREGVIRLWNRGAEVLFGFAADDAPVREQAVRRAQLRAGQGQ